MPQDCPHFRQQLLSAKKKRKKFTANSELSFIWGQMRTVALGEGLLDSSAPKMLGEGRYNVIRVNGVTSIQAQMLTQECC